LVVSSSLLRGLCLARIVLAWASNCTGIGFALRKSNLMAEKK
jgi:hypothetical protein